MRDEYTTVKNHIIPKLWDGKTLFHQIKEFFFPNLQTEKMKTEKYCTIIFFLFLGWVDDLRHVAGIYNLNIKILKFSLLMFMTNY